MKTQLVKQQVDFPFQTKAKNQGTHSSILQTYKDKTAQRQTDEEELLQGKFETVQRMGIEEEEPVQGKFETTQLASEEESLQRQPNNTGLPDNLKSGIENLSGYSMGNVKVHYNSSQPATLQAHAYAQGTDIHIAPGQEKHLPHEAWHVVQQKQGRVKPTMQMKGTVPVNDDVGLEKEADVMGAKALQLKINNKFNYKPDDRSFGTFQLKKKKKVDDFGKHPANKSIDPDEIGEENNGIREMPEDAARPDDVPTVPEYRLAMHKLHNIALVLENADRSSEGNSPSPDPMKLRSVMDTIQKKAKEFAKDHKSAMRNLSSEHSVEELTGTYRNNILSLTERLKNHTGEGENVIKKRNYVGKRNSLQKKGTNLWRQQWLITKGAVDIAMTSLWGGWKSKLQTQAKINKGNSSSKNDWNDRIDREGGNWKISYGGSLMKGYKGPPKQSTRFLSSNFDVDANIDAPGIAEYLINSKKKTVDRNQLDPKGANTKIEEMDEAMDKEVKKELLNAKLAPDEEGIAKIVSEDFETRVNVPNSFDGKLNANAAIEVKRSSDEQNVRDKLTSIRKKYPKKMKNILSKLKIENPNLLMGDFLKSDPLLQKEIRFVHHIINQTIPRD